MTDRPMTDEERFQRACEEYERKFGAPMGRDFSMPEDIAACAAIVERCIRDGREYDPYAETGAPEDAAF